MFLVHGDDYCNSCVLNCSDGVEYDVICTGKEEKGWRLISSSAPEGIR